MQEAMTRRLNAIDLCCGAGGWACAARDLPVRFVAVADLAADCLETWQLNHNAAHRPASCSRSISPPRRVARR